MYKNYKTLFKIVRRFEYPIGLNVDCNDGHFYLEVDYLLPIYLNASPTNLTLCGFEVCRFINETEKVKHDDYMNLRKWIFKTANDRVLRLLSNNKGLIFCDPFVCECWRIDDSFLKFWSDGVNELLSKGLDIVIF